MWWQDVVGVKEIQAHSRFILITMQKKIELFTRVLWLIISAEIWLINGGIWPRFLPKKHDHQNLSQSFNRFYFWLQLWEEIRAE